MTVFTAKGELTFDGQMAALRDFYNGTPTADVIWDLRMTSGNRISVVELRKIVVFIKQYADRRPPGRTALVSADNLDFGWGRVVEMYAEIENLPWHIRTFSSMSEATRWING
ncbi:hypothetical protein [Geobacter sp. FeAm09]|uniref:hypothetical protein n=1 Tax=Geobacter sp. FeAm09 TaxID=2597769 RepID=UPI00197A94A8|nr:hypothetical protein [Geobacter sp. FeAm09]